MTIDPIACGGRCVGHQVCILWRASVIKKTGNRSNRSLERRMGSYVSDHFPVMNDMATVISNAIDILSPGAHPCPEGFPATKADTAADRLLSAVCRHFR